MEIIMRKFILGTDWWTDCDDAVAIRILARAHKLEKIKITGENTGDGSMCDKY